jgi:transcriptional regulator with XRE-family HTH domain
MSSTDNFADLIRKKLAKDPELARRVESATSGLRVARQVYEARVAAGMTQEQLAEKIGTSQSAIARVEDADYDGHSTRLLHRIAGALGLAVRIELYDPHAVPEARVVGEITRVSQAQALVPWSARSVVQWNKVEVTVASDQKLVA